MVNSARWETVTCSICKIKFSALKVDHRKCCSISCKNRHQSEKKSGKGWSVNKIRDHQIETMNKERAEREAHLRDGCYNFDEASEMI